MARGMHKGPRNTRSDKWASEKAAETTNLNKRVAAFESINPQSVKTIHHEPGSNKK